MTSSNNVQWVLDGENIFSEEKLIVVRRHLESVGNIAVSHWHFYGSRSPTPLAFDNFDDFYEYLKTKVRPGDAIDVYPFPHDTLAIASGKVPHNEGKVPIGGAY